MPYNPKQTEPKWQKLWAEKKVFEVKEDQKKKKYYVLEMFPYPSGKLHMGHVRNYTIGDALARFKRQQGFNVLYPMGYDAFGLPAENAAIDAKAASPRDWTEKQMSVMKSQQKQMGNSYDWQRELATCNPDYYKWNQWLFLKFLEKGLAYKKTSAVNWCSGCETVLANEQVEEGKCWRCKKEITEKELNQWYLKITAYSDELLEDLEKLEGWPEKVKIMQKNWIGKSNGVNIKFKIKNSNDVIETFTTRHDTMYGMTFIVIAPEHPKVSEWTKGTEYEKPVKEFIQKVKKLTTIERISAEKKEKRGVFLGKYAIHPLTKKEIPIYATDFVLLDFGTGIVQAVPAHDQRDFDFAKEYNLPIVISIQPDDKKLYPKTMTEAYEGYGTLVNSDEFNGMRSEQALVKIADKLEKIGSGKKTTAYKLRDWLISRQRYWGTPIPIVYCDKCGVVPLSEKELPVLLPDGAKFTGSGNPLATVKSFVETKCPKCKAQAKRETDTMDTFFDSSWYMFRFCSPKENIKPFNEKATSYWLPVDQYIGGIEHAILHLMYARFFTKVLRDLKLLKIDEPFERLLAQGMVLKGGIKMSKSLGNVVDPGEIIEKFGADTARIFILFTALPEKELEWSDAGVEASFKFLNRIYRLIDENLGYAGEGKIDLMTLNSRDKLILSKTHRTIQKVTEEMQKFQFNYAISALMELIHELNKYENKNKTVFREAVRSMLLMLSPFAPHLAEELWEKIGEKQFISLASWPKSEEKFIDKKAEAEEEYLSTLISDIRQIKELRKIDKPKKIVLYTSPEWKYRAIELILKASPEKADFSKAMKELMSDNEIRKQGKAAEQLLKTVIPKISELRHVERLDEFKVLGNSKEKLKEHFSCEIEIQKADSAKYDPAKKAKQAMPLKPAIYIE